MRFHRIIGHTLRVLGIGFPLFNESLVVGVFNGLEIVPCRQMANQRLGINTGQFFFTHREGYNRNIGCFHALIAQLFVEGDVGITVDGGITTYLWVALLFGLINSVFGSIIKVLTFPVSIVTFGLFLFVVNAAMLSLTARWSEKLEVTGFWSALLASLIISVITTLFKSTKKLV